MSEQAEAILAEAKARVERGWCQGSLAVDAKGRGVPADSRRACAWCVVGAIQAVEPCSIQSRKLRRILMEATGFWSIADWNDAKERTKGHVLAAFDRAIQIAKEERGDGWS